MMLSAPAINATSAKLASGFSAAHNHTTLVSDKNKTTMKMIPIINPERLCAVVGAGAALGCLLGSHRCAYCAENSIARSTAPLNNTAIAP